MARIGQRAQHREVPVEQLQQQRHVAHDLDIGRGDCRHELIAGEPRKPDDEAEQRGEHDRDRGQHHGVEQRDEKDVEVGRGVAEVDQLLRDLESGRAREEREAGVDVEPRDVGDDVAGDPDEERRDGTSTASWIRNARHARSRAAARSARGGVGSGFVGHRAAMLLPLSRLRERVPSRGKRRGGRGRCL